MHAVPLVYRIFISVCASVYFVCVMLYDCVCLRAVCVCDCNKLNRIYHASTLKPWHN